VFSTALHANFPAGELSFCLCSLVVAEELVVCATRCSPLHGSLSCVRFVGSCAENLLSEGSGVQDRSYLSLRSSGTGESWLGLRVVITCCGSSVAKVFISVDNSVPLFLSYGKNLVSLKSVVAKAQSGYFGRTVDCERLVEVELRRGTRIGGEEAVRGFWLGLQE
jgi:hypothetical protein